MAPGNGPNRDPLPDYGAEEAMAGAAADGAEADPSGKGSAASAIKNQLVAKAWISTSEDPIISTNRKGTDFNLSFITTYWKFAKQYVEAKKKGHEKVCMTRAESFPRGQWTRIRQATFIFLAVKKRNPKTSGDNNKEEYYNRIRPLFQEELKLKKLPYTKPVRFEIVADYLESFPKFMSHMNDECGPRPTGKHAAQQAALLEKAKKKVIQSEGADDGNLSVADGGNGTNQGVAAMKEVLSSIVQQNHQLLQTAIQQQEEAGRNQMRALILAINPAGLPAFEQMMSAQQQQQQQQRGLQSLAHAAAGPVTGMKVQGPTIDNSFSQEQQQHKPSSTKESDGLVDDDDDDNDDDNDESEDIYS